MLWIQSRVDYTLNLPQILSKRQLSNSKHNQPFIYLQRVWILQSLNTFGSTKVLVDLRVRRPDSSKIQLGISCSSPTMIWLKRWGLCCKDNGIFQSPLIQNWETVSDPAGWPECKSLATSKVSPFGSASHHVSFCPSHLDSPQEPEKDRVAPLRPIALRRSSQWRNHQILREKIWTQGTVQVFSQRTQVFWKTYSSILKKRTSKSVKSSLYTLALSLSWRLHLWTRGSHPAVHVSPSGATFYLSVTSTLQAIRLSYPCEE